MSGRAPWRSWRRSCRGKHKYRALKHAERDAKALSKKDGAFMSVYLCEHCGAYHVGHTPYWARKRG